MAKVRAHIKVAEWKENDYIVTAGASPNPGPMVRRGNSLPTAEFAIDLDIPDSRFREAERVLAEIKIAESTQVVNVELVGDEYGA